MAKYHFVSTQQIGTHYAKTEQDARDEFIQWSFAHLLDLQQRHEGRIVRSEMFAGNRNEIVFRADGVEIERWTLKHSWDIMNRIRKLLRMK